MEEPDQHTVCAGAVDDELDRIGFVLAVAVEVEVGLAVAGQGACGQGARQEGVVELQNAVFVLVGTHGGVGLGKAAIMVGAAVYGRYALLNWLGIAFEIAGGSEGGSNEEAEEQGLGFHVGLSWSWGLK